MLSMERECDWEIQHVLRENINQAPYNSKHWLGNVFDIAFFKKYLIEEGLF